MSLIDGNEGTTYLSRTYERVRLDQRMLSPEALAKEILSHDLGTQWYKVLALRPPPANSSQAKRSKYAKDYQLPVGAPPHTMDDVTRAYKAKCDEAGLVFVEPPVVSSDDTLSDDEIVIVPPEADA